MHPSHLRAPFVLLALTTALTAFANEGGNDALTIYSTATPGVVVPDMTRNGGGGYSVPGDATVRHEREIALNARRNTVRVAKLDTADGSLELIGEDRIDHTPKNETLRRTKPCCSSSEPPSTWSESAGRWTSRWTPIATP